MLTAVTIAKVGYLSSVGHCLDCQCLVLQDSEKELLLQTAVMCVLSPSLLKFRLN